ncbi:MAG: FkbM family methyltransferase [Alphaproteobacteria bacterium]|nr:FkbM family methyltransferase [Alphaproteobacteria bacterium]
MIPFDGNFSPEDLDATLKGLGKDIFFVQIGAMDGVTYDPIHKFVVNLGWRGLLVEPIPYLHKKLQDNYKNCEGLIFSETAIADFEGSIEMASLNPATIPEGVFAPGAFGTSTLMPDRGKMAGIGMPADIAQIVKHNTMTTEVPCCRLNTLLARHQITKIDLMVVDVEGADWMVMRQLSLDDYRPRLVYLEYTHLSGYEQIACAAHFRNHGYRIYIDQNEAENFLAVRPE